MNKEIVLIKINDKPIAVGNIVKPSLSDEKVLSLQEQCAKNFNDFVNGYETRIVNLENKVKALSKVLIYLAEIRFNELIENGIIELTETEQNDYASNLSNLYSKNTTNALNKMPSEFIEIYNEIKNKIGD